MAPWGYGDELEEEKLPAMVRRLRTGWLSSRPVKWSLVLFMLSFWVFYIV